MRHPSLIPLSHDHHHGLALALRCRKQALGRLKPLGLEGLKSRAEECSQFYSAKLVHHFRAEEEILFPLLRTQVPESTFLIDQLLQEHQQIAAVVARLQSDAGLSKTLFDLGDLLERHIRKEERELFPMLEKYVGPEDSERLAERIQKRLVSS